MKDETDKKRWRSIEELFYRVCELPEAERNRVLDLATSDPEIRREVHSLLAYHDQEDQLLERPVVDVVMRLFAHNGITFDEKIPDQIGPYEIVELIGRGSMGSVFVAMQQEPRRKVALKTLNVGMDENQFIARFKFEHQTLAAMTHNYIAQVYNAGVTQDGRPYFTMEYVQGDTITAYCDAKKLNIRQRLELFLKVCNGVQHAHNQGVIHRDLKPSNILISQQDFGPVPKIIDFGIAKLTDQGWDRPAHATMIGTILGTPAYMSPEQASNEHVDTSTDVYALGIILYEMLVGALPFDDQDYKVNSLETLLHTIRERQPPRPSERLAQLKDKQKEITENRSVELKPFQTQLKSDLDWVVLTAVEKNRERRYANVTELVADIERFLSDMPVNARPVQTLYSIKKFIRRHRTGATMFSLALLGLILALSGLSYGLYREALARKQADKARLEAQAESRKTYEINEFLRSTLASAMPGAGHEGSQIEKMLEQAVQRLDNLDTDPHLEADLRYVMARTYDSWGLIHKGLEQAEEALCLWEGEDVIANLDRYAGCVAFWAFLRRDMGMQDMVEPKLWQVLADTRKQLGPDHVAVLNLERATFFLAQNRLKPKNAALMLDLILQRHIQVFDLAHYETLAVLGDKVHFEINRGDFATAEQLAREQMHLWQAIDQPISLATTKSTLASVLDSQGRSQEALNLARESYEKLRTMLGPSHERSKSAARTLALTLTRVGQTEEAILIMSSMIAYAEFGEEPPTPVELSFLNNMADLLMRQDRLEYAENLKNQELRLRAAFFPPNDSDFLISKITLAEIQERKGKIPEAIQIYESVLPELEKNLPPQNPGLAISMSLFGNCLCNNGQKARGLDQLRTALSKVKGTSNEPFIQSLLDQCTSAQEHSP